MRLLLVLAILLSLMCLAPNVAVGVPQNLTEHSWTYFQGTMSNTKIYQTETGYNGQKLVSGTMGTGTVSMSQSAEIYGFGDSENGDMTSYNEWGVISNNNRYNPTITENDLKNALCAKNYEVGSVFSESYSNIRDLVKDTNVYQDKNVSIYQIGSEAIGTTKIGTRIQQSTYTAPIYTMGGTYNGALNERMTIETGSASILKLPCP